MLKPLPQPERMYTGKSEAGAMIEGRRDNHAGNTMKPAALTRYHKIEDLHLTETSEPWAKHPLTQYEYNVEIRSYVPHSILFDLDDISLNVKRLETLSFWHASFQEIERHLGLIEKAMEHEFWKEIAAVVSEFKDDIIDCFKRYIHRINTDGVFTLEQFKHYAHEHEASASPWQGKKWSAIEKNPNNLKEAFSICSTWNREYERALNSIMKYDKPLIKADYAYAALRARPADYEILKADNEVIHAHCTKTRDRKAGGVLGLSQIEWPIFEQVDIKREIYKDTFESLVEKISGATLVSIIQIGAEFYQQLFNESEINCFDLRNAEKQVGSQLYFLPFNVDLGTPNYPSEIAGELYSGVGPTNPGAEVYVACLARALKNVGLSNIDKLYAKGDNFAWINAINCKETDLDLFFTNESTCLGADPERKTFWPYSFMTDNVKNRTSLPRTWRRLSWIQHHQYDLRPVQVIVNNGILNRDSCVKMMDWIVDKKLLQGFDVYSKDTINEAILADENIESDFRDKFSDEINFVHSIMPYHTDPNKASTDARITILR